MKSFVACQRELEKMSYSDEKNDSEKLVINYELFKKISYLSGSIVKCGIAEEEGLLRLAMFGNLISAESDQKIIAFEKIDKSLYYNNTSTTNGTLTYHHVNTFANDTNQIRELLAQSDITKKISFIPGKLADAIPEYLIENPDCKISYLNIDLDDYEASMTALDYFYPRLMHGGLLVFDNYYKKEEDYNAINDYFKYSKVNIQNLSINKGPHYSVRY